MCSRAASRLGVGHFVLLSAICVQKPLLGFQHAKLAFEAALIDSGLMFSIVRPTAFFKSLSGQVERVKRGKSFLVFGDGALTACKPISDGDLADYLADCLEDDRHWNRVLPIGGPGEAITPRQQGEALFALLGRKPRFRRVPLALLDSVIGTLSAAARLAPSLCGEGRTSSHRPLLRHGIDAGAEPRDGTLRRRRHALGRDRDPVRILQEARGWRRSAGAGGPCRVLTRAVRRHAPHHSVDRERQHYKRS